MRWNVFRSRRTTKLRPAQAGSHRYRLALEALEERCLLFTFNWVLPVDGDFNTSANWINTFNNQSGVPGPSDDAVISNPAITVTSALSTPVTVNSLACSATLSITNGIYAIGN